MIVASLLLAVGAVALLVVGLAGGSGPYLIGSIAASLLAAISLVAGGRQFGVERADDGSEHLGGDSADHVVEVEPDDAGRAGPGSMTEERSQVRVDGGVADQPTGSQPAGTPAAGTEPTRVGAPSPSQTRSGPLLLAADGSGERHDVGGPNGLGAPAHRDEVGGLEDPPVLDERGDPGDSGDPGDPGDPGGPGDEEPPDEPVAQPLPPSDAERLAGMDDPVLVIDGRPRYHLPGCVHLLTRVSERLPVREAVELGFTPCGLCEPAGALLAGDRRA